jgi:hypothetical protein
VTGLRTVAFTHGHGERRQGGAVRERLPRAAQPGRQVAATVTYDDGTQAGIRAEPRYSG